MFKACMSSRLKRLPIIIWFFFFFSHLLKRYNGPNLQSDTKLEKTSCFIAEKMVFDWGSLCTVSQWEAY